MASQVTTQETVKRLRLENLEKPQSKLVITVEFKDILAEIATKQEMIHRETTEKADQQEKDQPKLVIIVEELAILVENVKSQEWNQRKNALIVNQLDTWLGIVQRKKIR